MTLIAFAFAVGLLGANWVGVRFSNRELPPFFGAAFRFAIAAVILFAIVGLRRIELPRGRALLGAALYGAGQYFGVFALIYWALVAVPAGETSVIFATLPLWTLFLAAALGYERLTLRSVVGAVIAITGVGIVFSSELRADVPPERIAAVLVAALFGAITVIVQRAFPRTHPIATNAVGTLVGVPLLLVASVIAGEHWALPQLTATWLAVGYLVLSTVVGFVILTWLILRWSPTAPAYGTVLGPIVTVILATILAGETFGPGFFLGGAIVLIGTYLGAIAAAGRPKPQPAASPAK
jgi:drug/metabolite transporter (DMT)-like permease